MRRAAALVRSRRAVLAAAAVLIVVHTVLVRPDEAGIDHQAYLGVVERMRGGQGYYEALRDQFLTYGVRVSEPRSFRLPTTFLVWVLLPTSALHHAYLVLVVGATTAIATRLAPVPWPALGVTLYLLHAGRTADGWNGPVVDGYLLQELWVVPLVAASLLAWRREQWGRAAAFAAAATAVRELALPLLLAGLAVAVLRRRPWLPWAAGSTAVATLFVVHAGLASSVAFERGNEAPLLGTGRPPETVLEMMDWPVPGPLVFGLVLWALAVVQCHRRGELAYFGPYLAIACTGVVVRRPYWGLTFVPFTILLSAALVEELLRQRVRPRPLDGTHRRSDPSCAPT